MTLDAIVATILRVWALYNQSRLILGTLLALYAVEVIINLTVCILSARRQPVGMYRHAFMLCTLHNTIILTV